MRKRIQDERIIQEARKQNSLAFTILYYGVLLDLMYRLFILQEPISKIWDLALLYFGVSFYLAAKRVRSGLLTDKPNWRFIVPSSVVAAVAYSIVSYWYLGNTDPIELITGVLTFFVGFCAVNLFMQYISSKKNDNLLKDE